MTSCTCASRYNIAIVPHYWSLRLIEPYAVNDVAVHYRAARSIALLISILSGTEPSHANDQLPLLLFPSLRSRSTHEVLSKSLLESWAHLMDTTVKI